MRQEKNPVSCYEADGIGEVQVGRTGCAWQKSRQSPERTGTERQNYTVGDEACGTFMMVFHVKEFLGEIKEIVLGYLAGNLPSKFIEICTCFITSLIPQETFCCNL